MSSQQPVFAAPFPGAVAFALDVGLPVLVGSDGVQDAGVQREGVTEPGDPQGLQDPAGAGHQRQRSPAGAKPRAAAEQGAQAGRVQEADAAQVRDDVNGAVTCQVENPLADLRSGVRVDLAVSPQHGTITARGDGLQVKGLHAASSAGLAGPDVPEPPGGRLGVAPAPVRPVTSLVSRAGPFPATSPRRLAVRLARSPTTSMRKATADHAALHNDGQRSMRTTVLDDSLAWWWRAEPARSSTAA